MGDVWTWGGLAQKLVASFSFRMPSNELEPIWSIANGSSRAAIHPDML
jgi:hypothetical protein